MGSPGSAPPESPGRGRPLSRGCGDQPLKARGCGRALSRGCGDQPCKGSWAEAQGAAPPKAPDGGAH